MSAPAVDPLYLSAVNKIGVYTSGGDAPGMNACIRAVVRSAAYFGIEVVGIRRGYAGMIAGDFTDMTPSSVSNIVQRGGTILKTARSDEFRTPEGREKAAANLKAAGIDGLVAIGGDGTFRGGVALHREHEIPVVGCPGTIDNDLYGTDYTIGYDTAVNTALEMIDKIRDTADAHDRLFFVEVMGRDAGFIALDTGIGSGAEAILIPELKTSMVTLLETLDRGKRRNKTSSLIIVAEGEEEGGAFRVAEQIKNELGYEYRVVVLGHVQRGGAPSARDRVLASRLGHGAVEALREGHTNVMIGVTHNRVVLTPMSQTWKHTKAIDHSMIDLAEILST